MRFTSAIVGAAVTIGSSDAFLGLHRTRTQVNVNCGSSCSGTQQIAQPCTQSFRSGCSAPMVQAPMMPMMPAPMMQSAPQSCGSTCPPKQVVVQEVHRRPVTVNRVEYKPVVTQHTIEEEYRVNKIVNIPQQPVCQMVCPSATPSCTPCSGAAHMNAFPMVGSVATPFTQAALAPVIPAPPAMESIVAAVNNTTH